VILAGARRVPSCRRLHRRAAALIAVTLAPAARHALFASQSLRRARPAVVLDHLGSSPI